MSLTTPDVIAVGVGAAGMVDAKEGVLRFAPNLAWRNLPIAERMRDALGLPCQVDNDASMAAYGEFRFGAGRGYRHLLLVTVGHRDRRRDRRRTAGCSAARTASPPRSATSSSSPAGPLCGCGNRGCWEQVAAGRAIDRMGREEAREHEHSILRRLAGGDPDEVTGELVTRGGASRATTRPRGSSRRRDDASARGSRAS